MRNFPHQVNQIPKIRDVLLVAGQLLAQDQDIGDDGVFGYALARAGVYTFRNQPHPSAAELEHIIAIETQKPTSNQGPRTFARDLRRTLTLLGFVTQNTSGWQITASGDQIASLPNPPDPTAIPVWVSALLNLVLQSPDPPIEETHPARAMLQIVAFRPGIEKKWLAFALDMANDSRQELERVMNLQRMDFDAALAIVGTTDYNAANAVKIIPSLLEQLGLITIQGARCSATPAGLAALNLPAVANTTPLATRAARVGRTIVSFNEVRDSPVEQGRTRSTEEQLHSAHLLGERTSEHQRLVRRVFASLIMSGQATDIRVSDDAFDIVASVHGNTELLLIEAKTLRADALVQARLALGQVLFYEYFDAQAIAQGRSVIRTVVFDGEPGGAVRGFLQAYDVYCVVVSDNAVTAPTALRDYFAS